MNRAWPLSFVGFRVLLTACQPQPTTTPPPPRVRAAVLLLGWVALAMGSVAQGAAGEQRWSQYWGQVQSITIDRCGQRPGVCQGTVVLTLRQGRQVILAMRPGMWLKRGDHLVHLEELQVGDEIHVQAFEVAAAGAEQVAKGRQEGCIAWVL